MLGRRFNLVLTGTLTLGVISVAMARSDTAQPQAWDSGGPRRPLDVDSELAHLTKELRLTAQQREQIMPILVKHQQREQALHQNTSLSPDLRAKAHAISDQTHKEIDPLLTDRQRQLVKAIQERTHHNDTSAQPHASGGG
jgi:Spy/CpxP family protein refolding chaperone